MEGKFPRSAGGFEKEVIDHLAEVLSEDALKIVPASQYVRGGNLELFILCDLLSFEDYAEKLVHLAEHEGVLLVGMWWMKLPSGAPKRSNMTLRRT